MDPELIEELRKALTAHRRGVSTARVDSVVNERTEFGSLRELAQHAKAQGVPREELERDLPPPASQAPQGQESETRDPGFLGEASNVLESFGHSASFGLSDEIGGLLRGAVTGLVPGGQGFREGFDEGVQRARGSLEEARRETPVGTTVGEIGGAIAGPGAIGARFAMRGGGLLARSLRGAGAGAAEGAAFGAGTTEGGAKTRAEAALEGAKIGGGIGAVAPGAVAGAQAAGRGARAVGRAVKRGSQKLRQGTRALSELEEVEELESTIGPRLGDELRRGADVEGRPSQVRAEIDEARRGIFGELDEIEDIGDPQLREILKDDTVAPFVDDAVLSGKNPVGFQDAQGALRQVRKAKGAAMRSGDAASVRDLATAERKLGSRLSDAVEGFDEANEAYASHMARSRALEAGETTAAKSADELQEAFDALNSDVEREAFREGAAHWVLKRLDDHTAIPSTLRKIRTAPETRAKLRLLFDDDEAFESFTDAARNAERVRDRAKAGRLVERELIRQIGRAMPWIGGIGAGGAAASLL